MDVERWKGEELWKGLSWTDPCLMKSQRGRDKGTVPSSQCMLTQNTNTLYGEHQKQSVSLMLVEKEKAIFSVVGTHNSYTFL